MYIVKTPKTTTILNFSIKYNPQILTQQQKLKAYSYNTFY